VHFRVRHDAIVGQIVLLVFSDCEQKTFEFCASLSVAESLPFTLTTSLVQQLKPFVDGSVSIAIQHHLSIATTVCDSWNQNTHTLLPALEASLSTFTVLAPFVARIGNLNTAIEKVYHITSLYSWSSLLYITVRECYIKFMCTLHVYPIVT
jgi:hypothetical protein